MDREEYEALLAVIEQTIETSVAGGAGHLPGHRRDTHPQGLDRLEKTADTYDRLCNESDVDSGDPYLDAIDSLYRVER